MPLDAENFTLVDLTSELTRLEQTRDKPSQPKISEWGFVYALASACRPGLLKVGRTVNPDHRLRSFRSVLPDAEFLRVELTEHPARTENAMHKQLADKREHGEWFHITVEDFDAAFAAVS